MDFTFQLFSLSILYAATFLPQEAICFICGLMKYRSLIYPCKHLDNKKMVTKHLRRTYILCYVAESRALVEHVAYVNRYWVVIRDGWKRWCASKWHILYYLYINIQMSLFLMPVSVLGDFLLVASSIILLHMVQEYFNCSCTCITLSLCFCVFSYCPVNSSIVRVPGGAREDALPLDPLHYGASLKSFSHKHRAPTPP